MQEKKEAITDIFFLLPFIILLMISGCASLSKDECLSSNWTEIGENDATNGRISSQQIVAHTEACQKHGVSVSESNYIQGYAKGLSMYCTAKNGREEGLRFQLYLHDPGGYLDICPESLENEFLTGYLNGLKISLERQFKEIAKTKKGLRWQNTLLLALKLGGSSKADILKESIKDTESGNTILDMKFNNTLEEIKKWLASDPSLEDKVDWTVSDT